MPSTSSSRPFFWDLQDRNPSHVTETNGLRRRQNYLLIDHPGSQFRYSKEDEEDLSVRFHLSVHEELKSRGVLPGDDTGAHFTIGDAKRYFVDETLLLYDPATPNTCQSWFNLWQETKNNRERDPNLTHGLHVLNGWMNHVPQAILRDYNETFEQLGTDLYQASTGQVSLDIQATLDQITDLQGATLEEVRLSGNRQMQPDLFQNTAKALRKDVRNYGHSLEPQILPTTNATARHSSSRTRRSISANTSSRSRRIAEPVDHLTQGLSRMYIEDYPPETSTGTADPFYGTVPPAYQLPTANISRRARQPAESRFYGYPQ